MALAERPRNPWLAALLSFFVPGLGQAYLGRWRLALLLVAPVLILVIGSLTVWAVGMSSLRNQIFSSSFLIGLFVLNGALLGWRAFAISHAGLAAPDPLRGPSTRPMRSHRSVPVLATLGVLLMLTVGMHAYLAMMVLRVNATLGQVFIPPELDTVDGPGAPIGADPDDEEPAFRWDGEDRVNFLLVGVDEAPGRQASLTDTILVLSVDPADSSAIMVSVPRDTGFLPLADRTLYPDGLYPRKINELASEAASQPDVWCPQRRIDDEDDDEACGLAVLQDSIALYLGIPIHYYARIDLLGFERLIDAVGGVQLCLPGRLVDPSYQDPATGGRGLDLPAGCHRYSGGEALAYARSRQGWIEMPDGTRATQNDFARADRQQEILLALRDELDDTNLFELPQLLEAVGSLVTTDFPREQAGDLATLVPFVTGPSIDRTVLGYPEYVDLPADPETNYILTPLRPAIREEMRRLFGADATFESWYLAEGEAPG